MARNQSEDQPRPKTYRALRRTWISHESRMVEPGEIFTTAFPRTHKRDEKGGVVVADANGRLVVRPNPDARRPGDKQQMVEMDIGDNLEEMGGDAKPTEPAIGLEHGDKKPDVEEVLKSAQDHVDRQRASLPSPGLPRLEGQGEPQRAMDGPATRDTDDDKDAAETPQGRLARERAGRADPERKGADPSKDRSRG